MSYFLYQIAPLRSNPVATKPLPEGGVWGGVIFRYVLNFSKA